MSEFTNNFNNNGKSIKDIIANLEKKDIKLWVEGEALRCKAPKGVMNQDISDMIKSRKEEIIEYYRLKEIQNSLYQPIQRAEEKEYYPLSEAQKRMYFISQLDNSNLSYNMSNALCIEGNIDIKRLEEAFHSLIMRHEGLRTSFKNLDGEPVQYINSEFDFNIQYFKSEKETDDLLVDFRQPYDLAKAPLFRVGLVEQAQDKYILLMDMHHIISDGISRDILSNDLIRIYNNEILPELKIQYKDFAQWYNNILNSEVIKNQEQYWLNMFKGEIDTPDLPIDYSRTQQANYTGRQFSFTTGKELGNRLKQIAKQENTTLFCLLLAAYKIILSKSSGSEDITVGIPVSGRNHIDVENTVGMFINTLAVRSYPAGGKTIREYLGEVSKNLFEAIDNQDYQLDMLLQKLAIKRNLSRNPLFDTIFNSQNYSASGNNASSFTVDNVTFSQCECEGTTATFDITLYFEEHEGDIKLYGTYRTSLFKHFTIEYLMGECLRLLEEIANTPEKLIKECEVFSKGRLAKIEDSVTIDIPFEEFKINEHLQSIPEYFEQQVCKYKHKTAIKNGKSEISYEELNFQANMTAHYIDCCENAENRPVALLFEHGADMITAILSVLKAGRIFVPLELSNPEERLVYMLKDSGAAVLLCNGNTEKLARRLVDLGGISVQIINIELIDINNSDENLDINISPLQEAYILYTSGSTGKPKGVVQNHSNILRFMGTYINKLHINSEDKLVLLTSYSHAVGIIDIFSTLLSGGTLCIFDLKSKGNMRDLAHLIKNEEITIFHSVPMVYRYFTEELSEEKMLNKVRLIILGGEAVNKSDVELYRKYFSDSCRFVNFLGASEVLVATFKFIDKDTVIPRETVSAGYPVNEVEVLIINEHNEEARVYEVGEIVYQSECLALRYWNMPELTDSVFIANPLTGDGRVYKSGDLGRILPDGSLEYIGRNDNQVKIRGLRVELNEIEAIMDTFDGIEKSIVNAYKKSDGDSYLAAYFITREGVNLDGREIRELLKRKLPEYMIPSYYIKLEKLPVTVTGKIDRKVLPEPNDAVPATEEYSAPTNSIEEELIAIWEDELGKKGIGINHNFFESGGTSLKILRVHSKLDKIYPGATTVTDLFSYPTISKLASYIHSSQNIITKYEKEKTEISYEKEVSNIFSQLKDGSINLDEAVKSLFREE
ncbi:non-ribosomal peptide synthetase [Clostridium sp. BNL1100]|uniref:non-ribosomal peptide synthetase n=1 Tax=Clostridium sp. BNL1100 TaxID=755731 RepID=UPI00024A7599|nr:non-ribosomal peptide synthetase [Clostridium sp. BNL1100]AEY65152.1 amino acid adenylation enzyme/thioester reductase family protein [Clostridium sp. BNL1100]